MVMRIREAELALRLHQAREPGRRRCRALVGSGHERLLRPNHRPAMRTCSRRSEASALDSQPILPGVWMTAIGPVSTILTFRASPFNQDEQPHGDSRNHMRSALGKYPEESRRIMLASLKLKKASAEVEISAA